MRWWLVVVCNFIFMSNPTSGKVLELYLGVCDTKEILILFVVFDIMMLIKLTAVFLFGISLKDEVHQLREHSSIASAPFRGVGGKI